MFTFWIAEYTEVEDERHSDDVLREVADRATDCATTQRQAAAVVCLVEHYGSSPQQNFGSHAARRDAIACCRHWVPPAGQTSAQAAIGHVIRRKKLCYDIGVKGWVWPYLAGAESALRRYPPPAFSQARMVASHIKSQCLATVCCSRQFTLNRGASSRELPCRMNGLVIARVTLACSDEKPLRLLFVSAPVDHHCLSMENRRVAGRTPW